MSMRTQLSLLAIVSGLLFAVSGCAAETTPANPLKSGEALEKMATQGYPCDYPIMDKFESPLESYLGFHCLDSKESKVGYTVVFFTDEKELEKSQKKACLPPLGPGAKKEYSDTEFLIGSNWLATSDSGSKIDLATIEKALGGKRTSLAKLCG